MSTSLAARPAMRKGDIFRIIAIDDEAFDLDRLRRLASLATNPRCALDTFTEIDAGLAAALATPPHLVILDDALAASCDGERSIIELRKLGYYGPIAILSGLRRPSRNPDLVRAGAIYYQPKDDLDLAAFLGLVDMAMAVSGIMRARRATECQQSGRVDAGGRPVGGGPGQDRRALASS